jgi:glycosyltransferase involved in cell wall biosynthesis
LHVLAITNLYPTPERPAWGVFVEQQIRGLREIGVKVSVCFVNRLEQGMRVYFRLANSLPGVIAAKQPDLLHVMYGGVMADQVTRHDWRRPTIVTYHGSDLLGESFAGRARQWISRYGVYCSRRAARRANGVVVVSSRLQQALPGRLNPTKVRVIPCGIDLERFRPMEQSKCQEELGWASDRFHVLFTSHARNRVKRPELASAAVALLNDSGIEAELHFSESVPNSEMPVRLNASDALLVSSYHEGSPTIVKEALACHLPIVSVDVGDVAERIRGVEGCHLAEANPTDLARKLQLVRLNGRRLRPRAAALHEFSLEHTARTLASYYEEVLQQSVSICS